MRHALTTQVMATTVPAQIIATVTQECTDLAGWTTALVDICAYAETTPAQVAAGRTVRYPDPIVPVREILWQRPLTVRGHHI